MHELSIATSIVEIAQQEAGASRVCAVHLKLGPLAGVVKDSLLFSYEMAASGTPLEGSQLVIEEIPAIVRCGVCQRTEELPSIQQLACPACGAPTPELVQGTELQVTALEVDP